MSCNKFKKFNELQLFEFTLKKKFKGLRKESSNCLKLHEKVKELGHCYIPVFFGF